MSKRKIGERVGAISHGDAETIYLFGYGVYEGDFVPPERFGIPNPRIRLDNGKTVYGFQCWWGSEERIREICAGKKIIEAEP